MGTAVPFVGLTGGIGAGKSTALATLHGLGAEVISSDAVVHELYEGPELLAALTRRFGAQIAPHGVIDREALAKLVFASAEDRSWLEGVVWPLVAQRVADWLADVRAREPAPRAAVVEVPLLFEAGLGDGYDATIAVVAEERLRSERASARGHALLAEREQRQLSQEEKAQRATFVVRNDGSEQDLALQLSAVLAKLDGG